MTNEEIAEIRTFTVLIFAMDLICACEPTDKIQSELINLAASYEPACTTHNGQRSRR